MQIQFIMGNLAPSTGNGAHTCSRDLKARAPDWVYSVDSRGACAFKYASNSPKAVDGTV